MIMRWLRAVAQFPNLSGFFLSLFIVGAFFGQSLETYLFPIIDSPKVSAVMWNDGRLFWTVDFCMGPLSGQCTRGATVGITA